MRRFSTLLRQAGIWVIAGALFSVTQYQAPAAEATSADPQHAQPGAAKLATMVERATGFLRSAQDEDGSYSANAGPGITALVTTGLLRNGRGPGDPLVAKSLDSLQNHLQADGGIYQQGTRYRNYETCLAIQCFQEANRDGKYDQLLHPAEAFVKELQWDAGEGADRSDTSFGGAGYGKHNRPDLSNTSFLIDVLRARGCGPDDPAVKNLLTFVSRCQNLETEHNETSFASKNPDGGFYYTIAAGGSSQAGETATGGLRSYGSMTYAGLKSMIYAGVGPDDPRVQAALAWVRKNYTLKENPGLGSAALYYYYHTIAKALDVVGDDVLVDEQGIEHLWREELIDELAARQQADGSWINANPRWLEGDPNLVTGYVLLTLSYCRSD